jgi:hypothetical protein
MDSTLTLLKQEINATMDAQHDLAKWKLGVVAALGAAAFGLSKESPKSYWLLLFVPFVCAYIDLYAYQYGLRILVIARFLREHSEGDAMLQAYEKECEKWRSRGIYSLGNRAGYGCSLGVSILGPVFYFLQRIDNPAGGNGLLMPPAAATTIWLLGVLLIVLLWRQFQQQTHEFSLKTNLRQGARAA